MDVLILNHPYLSLSLPLFSSSPPYEFRPPTAPEHQLPNSPFVLLPLLPPDRYQARGRGQGTLGRADDLGGEWKGPKRGLGREPSEVSRVDNYS